MNFVDLFSCKQDKSNPTFTTPGSKQLAERQELGQYLQAFKLNECCWRAVSPVPFLPLHYCFNRAMTAKTSPMKLEGLVDKYSRDTTPTAHTVLLKNQKEQLIHGIINIQPSWNPKSVMDTHCTNSKDIYFTVLQTKRKCKLSTSSVTVTGIKDTFL